MSGHSDITENPGVSNIMYTNRSFMVRIVVSVCTCKLVWVQQIQDGQLIAGTYIYIGPYMPLMTLNYHINMEHSLNVFDNVSFHSTNSQIFYFLNVKMAKSLSAIMVSSN